MKYLIVIPMLALTSCAVDLNNDDSSTGVRGPISGTVYRMDPKTGKPEAVVDKKTLQRWFGGVTKLFQGESVKEVILDDIDVEGGSK